MANENCCIKLRKMAMMADEVFESFDGFNPNLKSSMKNDIVFGASISRIKDILLSLAETIETDNRFSR